MCMKVSDCVLPSNYVILKEPQAGITIARLSSTAACHRQMGDTWDTYGVSNDRAKTQHLTLTSIYLAAISTPALEFPLGKQKRRT